MPIASSVSSDALFAVFPEWRALARTDVGEEGIEFMVVEITPPLAANVEHGLVIDTSNAEVTVGFDCYHSHFDDWLGDGANFGTTAAIEFIKQIIYEKIAVVSWWNGDEWRGSAQLEVGGSLHAPDWATPGTYNRGTGPVVGWHVQRRP